MLTLLGCMGINKLYVEKSLPDHAFDLAKKLKRSDMDELAIMGNDPLSSLLSPFRYKYRKNINTYSVLTQDEEVIAMFGVIPLPDNERNGAVWFLSQQFTPKQSYYFAKRNKKWTDYFLSDYDYVFNIVPIHNISTIKWLKWQGFLFKRNHLLVKDIEMLYFYKQIQGVSKNIQPIIEDIGPIWTTETADKGQL